jgi:STE24 endopeptidase
MNETTGTRYQRLRRRVRVAAVLSAAVVLSIIAFTPLARLGGGWVSSHIASPLLAAVVFVAGLVLVLEVAALPAVVYFDARGVGRSRRARSSFRELLGAHVQAGAVTLALAVAFAVVWSVSVRLGGELWWAMASALLAGLVVVTLRLAPALFSRLGDVRPIARPGLSANLRILARSARVEVAEVHEWRVPDAADASALVTGAGRARRILIASPVLRDWSDAEIAVVVAHELAHHRHHDLHVTLIIDASIIALAGWTSGVALARAGAAAGLAGPADLAALPLLILVGGGVWLASTPLRLAISRWQERRADRFALRTTDGADAFSTAVRRLGAQHLAEERPSLLTRWLFQRHPSVAERVAMAEAYRTRIPR